MLHEQRCDGGNTHQYAALKISAAEVRFHRPADCIPFGLLNLRIDAAVRNDLDVTVGEQQIDQYAAVLFSVPDPQLRKHITSARPCRLVPEQRTAIERAFHREADLAGMSFLADFDGLRDIRQRRAW